MCLRVQTGKVKRKTKLKTRNLTSKREKSEEIEKKMINIKEGKEKCHIEKE